MPPRRRLVGLKIARIASLLIVVGVGLLFLTPTGCYVARAGLEEAKILSRRRPINEVVRDRTFDPVTRQKLRIVADARRYARDKIGLETGESFTTYSWVDSDTLLLVLSAAYRDRLEPYTWKFPIVGTFPYKGFFDFEAAKKDARELEDRGFDTYLRVSDAFSTLGIFNDPLLNTTLQRDSLDLVNTVIHEVTHNTFFAKGQVPFNESFANFVGARGAAEFFRSRGQEGAALATEHHWHDTKLLASFWTRLRTQLDSAYAQYPQQDTLSRFRVRDSVYQDARRFLRDSVVVHFQAFDRRYAEYVHMNNASLLARLVYATDLDVFDLVWEREERNLRRAIARIVALAKSRPDDPFGALREWVGPAL